jgi:hypothetical protein
VTTNARRTIRELVEDDIPQVVALYKKVFPERGMVPQEILSKHFQKIFFDNPWHDPELPSFVYQDSGTVLGLLGVMSRPMLMKDRKVRAAVTHHFMVEESNRTSLAGVMLVRRIFQGPQDLSLTDGANDTTRRIWEALGGITALNCSIYWTRPLRPSRYAMRVLSRGGRLRSAFALAWQPFGRIVDGIAARMPPNRFSLRASGLSAEDLHVQTFLERSPELWRKKLLRPEYDTCSLGWLFEFLAARKGKGTFQRVAVRDADDELLGWYLYYLNSDGIGDVLQITARNGSMGAVLDHLFFRAWEQGAIAVSGRLELNFVREFAERWCGLTVGPWMLAHAKSPDLLEGIYRGDAVLTRLEGDRELAWAGF